jgi:glyoxylase-like metal-dependent hydrolase (beta-lactamase superfamily II)
MPSQDPRSRDEASLILATHSHPDHVGNAVGLRDRCGAPIAIDPKEAAVVAGSARLSRTPSDGDSVRGATLGSRRPHEDPRLSRWASQRREREPSLDSRVIVHDEVFTIRGGQKRWRAPSV